MNRNVDIDQISDGKRYDANDMAKLGVDDCSGCHACCTGMGDSITLDPYDVYRLEKGLGKTFEELLTENLELRVADGVILPCLKMGAGDACTFLNDEGRCSIHPHRPGICRLFPLGRIYENDTHKYFLQIHECHKERQTKIKIKKWIDTPDFARYESYIDKWHYSLKNITDCAKEMPQEQLKQVNMMLLQRFYIADYDTTQDFYTQFEERMAVWTA
ncbi:YkgJ family cysteine cluster protein [Butyrivibrio sp. VCD2006]|uniref:YkgJ family cysteine cluster protein n=1 Tax=Butyrivibrio sp. VCD2006 TaxID=1280664 RepID=UPI000400E706|nr:YkgJ family cysteine cluster protein [Butyrivibrio sp. VCD2006]